MPGHSTKIIRRGTHEQQRALRAGRQHASCRGLGPIEGPPGRGGDHEKEQLSLSDSGVDHHRSRPEYGGSCCTVGRRDRHEQGARYQFCGNGIPVLGIQLGVRNLPDPLRVADRPYRLEAFNDAGRGDLVLLHGDDGYGAFHWHGGTTATGPALFARCC
ncbi:hypothetical protein D3C76_1183430 [compost metagenome]